MKKIVSLILAVMMLIGVLPLGIFTVYAAGTAVIGVESVSTKADSTVDVAVSISGNTGIVSMGIFLSFDSGLTLIGAQNGEVFSSLMMTPPKALKENGAVTESCRFTWVGDSNVTGDGVILVLKFLVSGDTLLNKNYNVSVTCESAFNEARESVNVSEGTGAIKVIDYTPGDVDGNGIINMLDVLTLCQYYVDAEGYGIDINPLSGDVDASGNINMLDVLMICQYYVDAKGYGVVLLPGKVVCNHRIKHVPAQTVTCTEQGNVEYWYCDKCKEYFSDSEGKTETTAEKIILAATGHTYSKAWLSNDTHHWHGATCGHTTTIDYNKHDFDENNICTVCGRVMQSVDYKETYLRYSEIGKTVNLITASDFKVAAGAKRLFTDAIYNIQPGIYVVADQKNVGKSFSSFSSYAEESALNISAKISFGSRKNKNNRFMTNKLPSIDIGASYSYENKKASETSEYIYSWDYVLKGVRVEISEFQNREKLASLLSPEFISDAQKIKDGKMSAADFVTMWGTHVITSGIYGAKLSANYYEISNHVSDYLSYKAALDAEFSMRFSKTELGIEAGGDYSHINSSCGKETIRKLLITGTANNTLICTSVDELVSSYQTWQANFEEDIAGNSVLVDVGEAGLCCIWYLLDDSFNDVKAMLDEYMYSQCSDLYYEYKSKLDALTLRDDVVFDKDTGTLEINLNTYQKEGNINEFKADNNFVTYKDGILSIKPYYNGTQIKRIIINGAYKTLDSGGQTIDVFIEKASIKLLPGAWYDNLKIELKNVGISGSENANAIDLTAVKSKAKITIGCYGTNCVRANNGKIAIAGSQNQIEFTGSGTLDVYGGDGADGVEVGDKDGKDGGIGIEAKGIVVDKTVTLHVYGGRGGKGAKGTDQTIKTADAAAPKTATTPGGNGGNGGIAIRSATVSISENAKVKLIGGKGGDGGAGGDVTGSGSYKGYADLPDGAAGGNGGNGGAPVNADAHITLSNTAELHLQYGDGGNGGNGGKGGDAGWPEAGIKPDGKGHGGKAGQGGSGYNGGDSGVGGTGGSSFTNYDKDFWGNKDNHIGTTGDGGDGNNGGNALSSVTYKAGRSTFQYGKVGAGGAGGACGRQSGASNGKTVYWGTTGSAGANGTKQEIVFDVVIVK